jgi:uncharacterized protein (TIGR03067 family)
MRRCGLAGLALALLLGGGAPADDKKEGEGGAAKKERDRLNGTWEVVSAVFDGTKQPVPRKATLTIKDDKYTVREGEKVVADGTFTVDPAATPKSVDGIPSSGPDKGKPHRGIYEVKGDTYRVCLAPPGKPRPKAFEAKEGSGHALVTYKRVKPKD